MYLKGIHIDMTNGKNLKFFLLWTHNMCVCGGVFYHVGTKYTNQRDFMITCNTYIDCKRFFLF